MRRSLLPKLEERNLRVIVDYRDFKIGAPSVREMERSVVSSRRTLMVMTPAYLDSAWTEFENLMVATLDPANRNERLIPLLLEPCEPPVSIAYLNRVDFTDPADEAFAWERLLGVFAAEAPPMPTLDTTGLPSQNPFTAVRAIQDPARFIGRTAELRRLQALLGGGSVSLTGEAKIGKSSLLWALKQQWPGKVIGPIDCQGLIDPDDFYEELAEALGLENSRWRTMRNALRDTPALLLLDEMGAAPSRGLEARHMEPFRSLCDRNRDLHIVTASRRPLREIFPTAAGSEFYNIFSPLMLGPLTNIEAAQLLTHPWSDTAPVFDAETVDELISLAGTHPFSLQRAAFQRFEALIDPAHNWRNAYQQDLEQML